MTKIRNSKYVWVIDYWNLRFVCNLVLEIWDFISSQSLPAKPSNSDLTLRTRFSMLNKVSVSHHNKYL